MTKLGPVLIVFFLTVTIGVAVLWGQDSQVSGPIRDTTQAAIPSAKIKLTRTETGEHRLILSTNNGYYSFPLVLPGHYELKVEKEGFQTQTESGLTVETGAISTVNVRLKVGSKRQTVGVDASLPLLQTESSAVAQVVENASITSLPLRDRRSAQLQRRNGFVVQYSSGSGVSFAIAGSRSNNADYLIDGGTAQNLLIGIPTLIFDPPIESVQEFNVAMSSYSGELGRSGVAVVQTTTKAGTNSFHSSVYEYLLRNTALQQQPEFANSSPALHYNRFGVSLGGPIKKDRTQFFFNHEGRRQNTEFPQSLAVPRKHEPAVPCPSLERAGSSELGQSGHDFWQPDLWPSNWSAIGESVSNDPGRPAFELLAEIDLMPDPLSNKPIREQEECIQIR